MKRLKMMTVAGSLLLTLSISAKKEHVTIQGDHGRLDAIIQTPDVRSGEKVPLVIICHGFTANKDEALHRTIADSLERHGVASLRFDFNGHGKSEGKFEDMTVPNEIEDAKKVYEYASRLPYVSRIGIAGHSQGGVVAAMLSGLLGQDKIAGMALMAPAAVLRDDALRGNTQGATYNPSDPPETVELHSGLKLGAKYILTATTLPIYETAIAYQGPELIIHGDVDRIVPYTYGQRFHYINKNSDFHFVYGADHSFTNDKDRVAQLVSNYFATLFGTHK